MLANATRLFNTRIRPNFVAFLLITVGVGLFLIDLFVMVDQSIVLQLIVAALLLIIFRDTKPQIEPVIQVEAPEVKIAPDLDEVLRDRKKYQPYDEFLTGVKTLWIYGPSAVIITGANEPRIRDLVLANGGTLRVIYQDPMEKDYIQDTLQKQLDLFGRTDIETDIQRTRNTLGRLKDRYADQVEHRALAYSPGFSLTVVNHDSLDALVIVEFFGYNIETRDERMHIVIRRRESERWFTYWKGQYEAMWQDAK